MNADNLYHLGFEPLLERAGLSGFTFHSLRHTSATILLSKNGNSKIVSEMLGHATISQTMDTYSHVMPGMGEVAATALRKLLLSLLLPKPPMTPSWAFVCCGFLLQIAVFLWRASCPSLRYPTPPR
jgi:hypothetical protein